MRSTNAFKANVFNECYREASSSFAGHRQRRHHNVLCHPASLVIGNAVITTCCVIQLRWSSATPSSLEECQRLRRYLRCNLYLCRIANTVPTTITTHPNHRRLIIGKTSAERISISRLLLPPSFTERSMPSFVS
ncbi:MAG: hypothetical protein RJA38_1070 [Bacteroidota bacterium]